MKKETINLNYLITIEPIDIPGLVSYWRFSKSSDSFTAIQGEKYTLKSQSGVLNVLDDKKSPHGGKVLDIKEGQWLNIPRKDCPGLDIHGKDGHFTMVAWIKRQKTIHNQCEFIAGQWNESGGSRQYGLFLNIDVWGQKDQICGHLSNVGGPTPGYKYCMDGSMGATKIKYNEWVVAAMSYDGQSGYSWLNGLLDLRPGLNPYPMAGGLYDGGENGSDFTVGAVDRSGVIGNFFQGQIDSLAFYNRALTPAEIFALSRN